MLGLFQSLELLVARFLWLQVRGLSYLAYLENFPPLISAIPAPVIGGVFVVVCGIISVSGMKVMSDVTIHEKRCM